MEFKTFGIDSASELAPYLEACPYLGSDYSLGCMFMWQKELNIQYAITNETFVLRFDVDNQASFSFPSGKHVEETLEELIEYVKDNRLPLRFYGVNEEELDYFRNEECFHNVNMSYDDRWSDYIYSFKDVLTFSGKKYKGQRNHINKFKALYGEPIVKNIEEVDIDKVFKMLEEYEKEHQDYNALEKEEYLQTIQLIKNRKALNQKGIVLLNEKDEVIGVSIGEVLHDTLDIHIEKALKSYEGVYPTLYQSFVRYINDTVGELSFINREDDSGDEGLRISKRQYQPIKQLHKYVVQINSPIMKVDWKEIIGEKVYLTRFMSKDKKAYYDLNTDIENNKLWGYNYEEDLNITDLNENTFYDMAIYDMDLGASINYAIREIGKEDMIGEVILWNFTYEEEAELGCRIAREYQHKGYGKEAYSLFYNYAINELGLKVWSRCYKENKSSRDMIEAAGLKLYKEDDTFYYFK